MLIEFKKDIYTRLYNLLLNDGYNITQLYTKLLFTNRIDNFNSKISNQMNHYLRDDNKESIIILGDSSLNIEEITNFTVIPEMNGNINLKIVASDIIYSYRVDNNGDTINTSFGRMITNENRSISYIDDISNINSKKM